MKNAKKVRKVAPVPVTPYSPVRVHNLEDVYITADLHFYDTRMAQAFGFKSGEQMTADIVDKWNQVVPDESAHVYVLGDVSLGNPKGTAEALGQMMGQKHLILGNHDWSLGARARAHFVSVADTAYLKVKCPPEFDPACTSVDVWLSHYKHASWPNSQLGSVHLHGHSHGNLGPPSPSMATMDVGIEATGRAAVSLDVILQVLRRMPTGPAVGIPSGIQ